MIEKEFDASSIKSFQLGVSLYSGEKHLVPIDNSVNSAFADMLARTTGAINTRLGEWEEFSLSQDYGNTERVYSPRSEAIFKELSDLHQVQVYPDMANFTENATSIDFYFVIFHDEKDRKVVGVRKATQLKSTLGARNRFFQMIDNTMFKIENPVFRFDKDFDGLICDENIYFHRFLNMEYIAKITNKIAKAAEQKIPAIAAQVAFLDFSGFVDKIENHPRTARLIVAISKRPNLDKYDQAEILAQAAAQGVGFVNEGEPCLRCRVADKHKLLEVLDDRRWISKNTADEAVPYRASSRQRSKS